MTESLPMLRQGTTPRTSHSRRDLSIAVITCTRDLPRSLRRTMESFAAADRAAVACRFVLVNNPPARDAEEVAHGFDDQLSIRVLREQRPGEGRALNRALPECVAADVTQS